MKTSASLDKLITNILTGRIVVSADEFTRIQYRFALHELVESDLLIARLETSVVKHKYPVLHPQYFVNCAMIAIITEVIKRRIDWAVHCKSLWHKADKHYNVCNSHPMWWYCAFWLARCIKVRSLLKTVKEIWRDRYDEEFHKRTKRERKISILSKEFPITDKRWLKADAERMERAKKPDADDWFSEAQISFFVFHPSSKIRGTHNSFTALQVDLHQDGRIAGAW